MTDPSIARQSMGVFLTNYVVACGMSSKNAVSKRLNDQFIEITEKQKGLAGSNLDTLNFIEDLDRIVANAMRTIAKEWYYAEERKSMVAIGTSAAGTARGFVDQGIYFHVWSGPQAP